MKPEKALQQGNLDCLCGVYALVNAYRLLVPSDRDQYNSDWQLFKASVECLNCKDLLLQAVTSGLEVETLLDMNKKVFKPRFPSINIKVEQLWKKEEEPDPEWLNQRVEKYVTSSSRTVLACYTSSYEHWTVFQKIVKNKVYLYDSRGGSYTKWPLNFTPKGLHYDPRNILLFHKIKNGNGK